MRVQLTWEDPTTGEPQTFSGSLPISIGRSAENTLVLTSEQISRKHAQLEDDNGTLVIIDQGSRNGTIVNQQSVQKATLKDGASFQVGPFLFVVDLDVPAIRPETAVLPTEAPRAPEMETRLRVRWEDPDTGEFHEQVAPPPVTIGRGKEVGNTIVLADPTSTLSRQHIRLTVEQNQVVVEDNDTVNGTFLNEGTERIQRQTVTPGDVVRIGPYRLRVTLDMPDAPTSKLTQPPEDATVALQPAPAGGAETTPRSQTTAQPATLVFSEDTGTLAPFVPAAAPADGDPFAAAGLDRPLVSVRDLERSGIPTDETTYLALGGGLGSFVWVDHLLIHGVRPEHIVALGVEEKPYGRYQRLCRNSQIPPHERLRSNADSCPDNVWGWPGYALRESWHSLLKGQIGQSFHVMWQVFGEPTLAQTYTPRSGNVFASLDREVRRIGWDQIWRYGRVKVIRKTDDERYVVAYSQTMPGTGVQNRLILAPYVHVAIGYPGVRFLDDLQMYRESTRDFRSVVNAYEDHEHVYAHLLQHGGIVLVRGRGIVASRIIQRLYEIRARNPRVQIVHLMRTPVSVGYRFGRAQRRVENHWEFQPFNWPKACWGGILLAQLENADDQKRKQLLTDWGGTTTADRADWKRIVEKGLREGWYQIRFGNVRRVERDDQGNLDTIIRGSVIEGEEHIHADFIIDCTGLESAIEDSPVLRDLVGHYQLGRNGTGRLKVTNDYEIVGMENGKAHMYASGVMTLGGPHAAVDSFLGLQYAAQRSVDGLTRLRAPGLRYLNGLGSVTQWMRWAMGVRP